MLQNIREIGIFMIVAQAVVHFAPGRQYEKYIKSISGVIILLLFLRPFVQAAGGQWQDPETLLGRWAEAAGQADASSAFFEVSESGVENAVKRRMEEEVKERLNRELAGESYVVKQVCLMQDKDDSFSAGIVIGEREDDGGKIVVDTIRIGAEPERERVDADAYRPRFAELLGLEEERVEVRWDG